MLGALPERCLIGPNTAICPVGVFCTRDGNALLWHPTATQEQQQDDHKDGRNPKPGQDNAGHGFLLGNGTGCDRGQGIAILLDRDILSEEHPT